MNTTCEQQPQVGEENFDKAHETMGTHGSNLLYIRKDIARFAKTLGAAVASTLERCPGKITESHTVIFGDFLLRTKIAAVKPGQPIHKPFDHSDTAFKLANRAAHMLHAHPQAHRAALSALVDSTFKRQGDHPNFIIDQEGADMNLVFFDSKYRTLVTIDLYRTT